MQGDTSPLTQGVNDVMAPCRLFLLPLAADQCEIREGTIERKLKILRELTNDFKGLNPMLLL